jgi:hypothetical protein
MVRGLPTCFLPAMRGVGFVKASQPPVEVVVSDRSLKCLRPSDREPHLSCCFGTGLDQLGKSFLLQVPCIAVVENMCYFEADGKKYFPFGQGSGQKASKAKPQFPFFRDICSATDFWGGQSPKNRHTM